MESFIGYMETALDALLLLEGCRTNALKFVSKRLDEGERSSIHSGQIFVWDEEASGIQRWTDGRRWSSSRPRGNFIIYRELCEDSEIDAVLQQARSQPAPATAVQNHDHVAEDAVTAVLGPGVLTSAGIRVPAKPNGLIKRALSVTTSDARRFHLVSYYSPSDLESGRLVAPRHYPTLRHLQLPDGFYPTLTREVGQDGAEAWRFATSQGRGHASALSPDPASIAAAVTVSSPAASTAIHSGSSSGTSTPRGRPPHSAGSSSGSRFNSSINSSSAITASLRPHSMPRTSSSPLTYRNYANSVPTGFLQPVKREETSYTQGVGCFRIQPTHSTSLSQHSLAPPHATSASHYSHHPLARSCPGDPELVHPSAHYSAPFSMPPPSSMPVNNSHTQPMDVDVGRLPHPSESTLKNKSASELLPSLSSVLPDMVMPWQDGRVRGKSGQPMHYSHQQQLERPISHLHSGRNSSSYSGPLSGAHLSAHRPSHLMHRTPSAPTPSMAPSISMRGISPPDAYVAYCPPPPPPPHTTTFPGQTIRRHSDDYPSVVAGSPWHSVAGPTVSTARPHTDSRSNSQTGWCSCPDCQHGPPPPPPPPLPTHLTATYQVRPTPSGDSSTSDISANSDARSLASTTTATSSPRSLSDVPMAEPIIMTGLSSTDAHSYPPNAAPGYSRHLPGSMSDTTLDTQPMRVVKSGTPPFDSFNRRSPSLDTPPRRTSPKYRPHPYRSPSLHATTTASQSPSFSRRSSPVPRQRQQKQEPFSSSALTKSPQSLGEPISMVARWMPPMVAASVTTSSPLHRAPSMP